jgi:hypothetical protein
MATAHPSYTVERLAPLLRTIADALGGDVEELAKFERWALLVTGSMLVAGRESAASLEFELARARADLVATADLAQMGPLEPLRVARREWLTTLLELIEANVEQSVVVNYRVAAA